MPTTDATLLPAAAARRRALAYAGLALAVLSLASITLALPWPFRFPLLTVALMYGPGTPLVLLVSGMPAGQGVIAGLGFDVSVVLLAGEWMVAVHEWQPIYLVSAQLVITAIVSVCLLRKFSRHPEARHA